MLEHTKEMVDHAVGSGEDADWIKTGKILDASSRIFATRADQVVKQGEKLRFNMLKDAQTREKEDQQEANAAKAAQKRRASKNTIAEAEKLTQQIECSMEDPMFTVMSETFDAGLVSGLLMNTLHAQDEGELVFCSDQRLSQSIPGYCTQLQNIDTSFARQKFNSKHKQRKKSVKKVCSYISLMKNEIENFKNGVDEEEDEDMFEQQEISSADEDFGVEDFGPENTGPVEQELEDVEMPADLDNLCDDMQRDGFMELPPSLDPSPSQEQLPEELPSLEELQKHLDTGIQLNQQDLASDNNANNLDAPLDLFEMPVLYSKHYKAHGWADSQQWSKARRIDILRKGAQQRKENRVAELPGEPESAPKKRKKRKENWIDFKNPRELTELEKRRFQRGHSNQFQITDAKWRELKLNSHSLPTDFKITEKLFYKPFLLPKKREPQRHDEQSASDPLGQFDEDGHFVGGNEGFDDFGAPGFDHSDDENIPPEEDEMLDLGEDVEKEDKLVVPFEVKASTINIRALKSTLYKVIKDCQKTSPDGKIEFQTIVDKLNSSLSRKTLKRLTPHLVFITLLYLCNDKGLKLDQVMPRLHTKDPVPGFTVEEVGLDYTDEIP